MRPVHILRTFVAAAAASFVLASAQSPVIEAKAKEEVLSRMTRLIDRNAFVPGVDFGQWPQFLEKIKPEVEKAATEEDFASVVNGALRRFGFSHIALQTPRETTIFRQGTTVGIGVTSQVVDDGVMIVRVVPDGPADKAGIRSGDLITEVDGEPAKGIQRIIGAEGTDVKLKVKKADGKIEDITLTRRKFSTLRPEELEWIDKETPRLSIFTFGPGYNAKRVEKLLGEAKAAPNLILDLRDNGGGAVLNLQHLLGQLISSETQVGTFVTRRMVDAYKEEHPDKAIDLAAIAAWAKGNKDFWFETVRPARSAAKPYDGNIVVLVNGGSGSASEIAAAALREKVGAQIAGQKSAGAVLVSVIVPATNGFQLQYPLSDYVTANGLRLEGQGVVPDAVSTEPRVRLPGQPDDAVAKARELLAKIAGK